MDGRFGWVEGGRVCVGWVEAGRAGGGRVGEYVWDGWKLAGWESVCGMGGIMGQL